MSKEEKNNKIIIEDIYKVNDEIFHVVIRSGDDVFKFAVDAWELVDEKKFLEYLNLWKNEIIPKRKTAKSLSSEYYSSLIKKYKSMEL